MVSNPAAKETSRAYTVPVVTNAFAGTCSRCFAAQSWAVPKPKRPDLTLPLLNWQNNQVGDIVLPGSIFNVPVRRDILHRVVTWQLAKRRQVRFPTIRQLHFGICCTPVKAFTSLTQQLLSCHAESHGKECCADTLTVLVVCRALTRQRHVVRSGAGAESPIRRRAVAGPDLEASEALR